MAKKTKEWTGWHVLAAVVIFFGIILAANISMISLGLKSFPGEDTKQSYRQGLEFNKTLADRQAQKALGWSADITVESNGTIILKLTDKTGQNVRGLRVNGMLKHPAETDKDVALKFAESANGNYIAIVDKVHMGKQWVLLTSAQKPDGTRFDTRNELWLKQ